MRMILALLVALLLSVGLAAPSEAVRLPGHFGEMDGNEDSFLSWDEVKAYLPTARKKEFEAIDKNKDGRIDYGEWQASRTKLGLVKDGQESEAKDIKDKDLKASGRKGEPTKPFKTKERKPDQPGQAAADQKKPAAQPGKPAVKPDAKTTSTSDTKTPAKPGIAPRADQAAARRPQSVGKGQAGPVAKQVAKPNVKPDANQVSKQVDKLAARLSAKPVATPDAKQSARQPGQAVGPSGKVAVQPAGTADKDFRKRLGETRQKTVETKTPSE